MSDFYILNVIHDPTMDRSQSLNVPPFFDGSNYAFWKVHMRAFLFSIDESVWDAVKNGWTRLKAANLLGIRQPLQRPMLIVKL